jgi:hypothetical protein
MDSAEIFLDTLTSTKLKFKPQNFVALMMRFYLLGSNLPVKKSTRGGEITVNFAGI